MSAYVTFIRESTVDQSELEVPTHRRWAGPTPEGERTLLKRRVRCQARMLRQSKP